MNTKLGKGSTPGQLLLEVRDLLEQLNDPVYLIAPMTIETIARIRALLTKLESED